MKHLVSIIMPAYNCEKFVTEAINSVLNQTYQNYELIIIDDCSKDNTQKVIEEISKKNDRIIFLKNSENIGVSATRNKGVSLAKGDWIAFLDADDCWREEKLAKQIEYAEKIGANFLFTGSAFINEYSEPYSGILQVPEKVSYKELLKQNIISCSSVLIKKEYLDDCKMENDETHEDFGAWLRILKEIPYAYGLNEPLLIYRLSSNSKSSNKFKSIGMTYKTYRYVKLNPLLSFYYLGWYIIKGLRKYNNIKSGGTILVSR